LVRLQRNVAGPGHGPSVAVPAEHPEHPEQPANNEPKTRAGEDRVVDLDAVSIKVPKAWRRSQDAVRRP
jgi:hypothetical protein